MDSIRSAIENVSLYDVKAAVRKAQNVVMNYTEMEAKVREATNNEPWGASSTLMNEIATGTYNYQLLNEIMPMIYKRFTEKSAEEWRQIYKALQLLEFLIKNGSEQVIDDARSHLSTIKMLRQFYFIDMNGKDQGINVRNRAKELAELLSDVDRIRQERKKARANRNKYAGVEGGAGTFGGLSGASFGGGNGFGRRYGGFGSDSAQATEYGGYSGGVYGDGGGFGGATGGRGDFHDSSDYSRSASRNKQFEEYDEYDEADAHSRPAPRRHQSSASTSAKPPPPKKAPEPVPDLLGGFDDEPAPAAAPANGKGKQQSSSALDDFGALTSGGADDDDFDDFQSATPATSGPSAFSPPPSLATATNTTSLAQPTPLSTQQHNNIESLVGMTSPTVSASSGIKSPPTMTPLSTGGGAGMASMNMSSMNTGASSMSMSSFSSIKPTNTGGYQPQQPNYFTSVPAAANSMSPLSPASTGTSTSISTNRPASFHAGSTSGQKKSGSDAFAGIWGQASVGIKKSTTPVNNTPSASLQAMAKERASAGIWGASTPAGGHKPSGSLGGSGGFGAPPAQGVQKTGGDLDDLLG